MAPERAPSLGIWKTPATLLHGGWAMWWGGNRAGHSPPLHLADGAAFMGGMLQTGASWVN